MCELLYLCVCFELLFQANFSKARGLPLFPAATSPHDLIPHLTEFVEIHRGTLLQGPACLPASFHWLAVLQQPFEAEFKAVVLSICTLPNMLQRAIDV